MNTHSELLTAEDERRLGRAIEAGVLAEHLLLTGERPVPATDAELQAIVASGRAAWQQFWLANLRLVWKLARAEAVRSGLGVEELFQEGCLGLAGAIQRFDARRGRFSTYAVVRIRQCLVEVGATRFGELGLPPSRAVRARRLRGVRSRLDQQLQRTVGPSDIARESTETPQAVAGLLGYRLPVSLDDAESLAPPITGCEEVVDRQIFAGQLRELLASAPRQEAAVLRCRYGLDGEPPLSLAGAAERLRVSVSTARRWEQRGLVRLRAELQPERDPAA